MLKINEAYAVLSDTEKRRMYDVQLGADHDQTMAQEDSVSKSTSDEPPYRPPQGTAYANSGYSQQGGCLSRLFKTVVKLCVWGGIIYIGIRLFSGGLNDIATFAADQWSKVSEIGENEESATPLDDKYDEGVSDILREAEIMTDDEERYLQFSTALSMQMMEFGFKTNAYLHYVGESPENKSFFKEQNAGIEATQDKMRQYYSDDDVSAAGLLALSDYYLCFDDEYFDYDYRFGSDWNKNNIDIDTLWEMYL